MPDRVVVGVTAFPRHVVGQRTSYPGQTVDVFTVRAIAAAGGVPLILPVSEPDHAEAQLRLVDALVLSGGTDLDPTLYGGSPHPSLEVDEERDRWETALIGAADARRIPLLGVCRGAQLLNVHHGGTLVPDLDGTLRHDLDIIGGGRHEVVCAGDSLLAAVLGRRTVAVASSHHQAIDRLGTGLAVCAAASDGIVEAVESSTMRAIGVQWHPEFQLAEPAGQPLFDWLVREAA